MLRAQPIIRDPVSLCVARLSFNGCLQAMHDFANAHSPKAVANALPLVKLTCEAYGLPGDVYSIPLDARPVDLKKFKPDDLNNFKSNVLLDVCTHISRHAKWMAGRSEYNDFIRNELPDDSVLMDMSRAGVISWDAASALMESAKILRGGKPRNAFVAWCRGRVKSGAKMFTKMRWQTMTVVGMVGVSANAILYGLGLAHLLNDPNIFHTGLGVGLSGFLLTEMTVFILYP